MERHNEELEINLLELLLYLKKKIVIIVAVCLVFAVAGFLGTEFLITPTYTASTRVYVLNRSDETAVVSADFTLSNYLISDYKALITGRNVTREVINQLGLNLSDAELAGKINVTAETNTRMLQIDVVDTDPQRAADVANTVREVASEQIKDIMAVDAVNTIYEAERPRTPSGPSVTRNTAIAAVLGLVVAVGIFVVIFILDDTIRTEEDVERYLGLGTLGAIPISDELESPASSRSAAQKSARKSKKKRAAMNKLLDQKK